MPRLQAGRSRSCCLRSMAMLLGLASFNVMIVDHLAAARSAQLEGDDVYSATHDALLPADAMSAANSDAVRGAVGAQSLAWEDAALPGRALLHRGCHRPRCIPRCPRCNRLRRHCRRRMRIFNCEPGQIDYFAFAYSYDYFNAPDYGAPPSAAAGSGGVPEPEPTEEELAQIAYESDNPYGYVYEEEAVDYIEYDYDASIYIDTAYSAEDADSAAGPAADISSDLPAAGPDAQTDEYPGEDEQVSLPLQGPAEAEFVIAIEMIAPADVPAPASASFDGTYA
eukprot:jgi/Ulvmu1/11661/UM008_0067.1